MITSLRKTCVLAALLCFSIAASGPVWSEGVSSNSISAGQRMRNPFVGAVWYVNSKWRENVLKEPNGSLMANYSTAVWITRIGAIAPTDGTTWGLAQHLDNALSQKANLIEIVIYDLPNRDCSAMASSGELLISKDGFNRYKKEYITPIVKILSDVKYKDLRIIAIIEPDSLPNLVTNTTVKKCQEAAGPGGYVEATQFTLDSLYPISNVYSYVDIGHSGWLGWDEMLDKTAAFIAAAIKGTSHGVNSVAGFISNTANYTPLSEPFLEEFSLSAMPGSNGSIQVRQARFYEWNPRYGELAYARTFRAKMISLGFPSTIGMLIDTSRNGWGGASRPQALSTNPHVDTFVDQSRIDRRVHRGMWCNQPGGIGERPTATPEPGIDAYVWVKAPGESDGVATAGIIDPADPAKAFDRFCDPTFIAPGSGGQLTGAMPRAPHAGYWFSAGFKVLTNNAYPPLK
jgi:cellulose 1,4-beta-cellobiosidase